jgi:hypothetical protein
MVDAAAMPIFGHAAWFDGRLVRGVDFLFCDTVFLMTSSWVFV